MAAPPTPPNDGWQRQVQYVRDGYSRDAILTLLGFHPKTPPRPGNQFDDEEDTAPVGNESALALKHLAADDSLNMAHDHARFGNYIYKHLIPQVPQLTQWDRQSDPAGLLPDRVKITAVGQLEDDETDPRNLNSPEWRRRRSAGQAKVESKPEPGYQKRPKASG